MYAVLEARKTHKQDVASERDRAWGEPELVFIAQTFDEVTAWWENRVANEDIYSGFCGWDYIVVVSPEGVRNLLNQPIKPDHEGASVQVRMGVFDRPLTV